MYTVTFYRTRRGASPIHEYINAQHPGDAARITNRLALLEARGTIGNQDIKPLGHGLWEIRIIAINSHRILYTSPGQQRIVLLHAFTKKSQKTPPAEIETATRRLRELKERGEL